MDNCGLWKRFSYWLCEEPKKSSNWKSRELHCLNMFYWRLCAFCRLSFIACSKHRLYHCRHFRAYVGIGAWILVILVICTWLSPWAWRARQGGKRRLLSQWLSILGKNIQRHSPLHLRIRAILYESWTRERLRIIDQVLVLRWFLACQWVTDDPQNQRTLTGFKYNCDYIELEAV